MLKLSRSRITKALMILTCWILTLASWAAAQSGPHIRLLQQGSG